MARQKRSSRRKKLVSQSESVSSGPNTQLRWDRDRLSREIWQFYLENTQSGELLYKKKRLKDALSRILSTHFPKYDVELYMVGSTLNGLANNSSDIDICLVMTEVDKDPEKDAKSLEGINVKNILELLKHTINDNNETQKTETIVSVDESGDNANTSIGNISTSSLNGAADTSMPMLELVRDVLKNYNFVTSLQIIAAKVPILKFVDSLSKLEVTLNINKLVSIRNTYLILDYTRLDWRLQPLVMIVKAWAKDHGINDAYNKSISSYSIVLMVIHYLQYAVSPPVLPCLQRVKPDRYAPDTDIRVLKADRPLQLKWKSQNQATLKELLIGFLDYYSYNFCYERDAISVRLGQTLPRHVVQRYKAEDSDNTYSHWKFLCIEEPFNRTNTARSVYDELTFQRILSVFRVSHYTIRRYSYLDSIMTGQVHHDLTNHIEEYLYTK